jgi:hypothetical protein
MAPLKGTTCDPAPPGTTACRPLITGQREEFPSLNEVYRRHTPWLPITWPTVQIVARALLIRKKLEAEEAEAAIAVIEGSYQHASWILIEQYGWTDDDVAALTVPLRGTR